MAGTPIVVSMQWRADSKQAQAAMQRMTAEIQKQMASIKGLTVETNKLTGAQAKEVTSAKATARATDQVTAARQRALASAKALASQDIFLAKAWDKQSNLVDSRYLQSIEGLRRAYGRLGREAKQTAVYHQGNWKLLSDNSLAAVRYRMKMDLLGRTLQNVSTNVINLGKNVQWTGRQMMVGITMPLLGLAAAASKVYYEANKLDIQLQKLIDNGQGLSNVRRDMEQLDDQAISMSESWGIAANEIKEVQSVFAAIGFPANEIEDLTQATIEFAAVGDIAHDSAAEVVRVLRQQGMAIDEVKDTLERFNKIEDETNLSMQDIAASFVDVFPTLSRFNVSAAETTALLAAITQGGFEASEAARALNFAFTKLPAATAYRDLGGSDNGRRLKALIDSLDQIQARTGINVSLLEDDGQTIKQGVDLIGAMAMAYDELMKSTDGTDKMQAIAMLRDFFGSTEIAEGVTLLEALADAMGDVDGKGQDLAKALGIARDESDAAAKAWERQLGIILGADSTKFSAQVQTMINSGRELGQKVLPMITNVFEMLNNVVDKFMSMPEGMQENIINMLGALMLLGPAVFGVGQAMIATGTIGKGLSTVFHSFFKMKFKPNELTDGVLDLNFELQELRDQYKAGMITTGEFLEKNAQLAAGQHIAGEAADDHANSQLMERAQIDLTTSAVNRQAAAVAKLATMKEAAARGEAIDPKTIAELEEASTAALGASSMITGTTRSREGAALGESGLSIIDAAYARDTNPMNLPQRAPMMDPAIKQAREEFRQMYLDARKASDGVLTEEFLDLTDDAVVEAAVDLNEARNRIEQLGSADALRAFAREAAQAEVGTPNLTGIHRQRAEVQKLMDDMLAFEDLTGMPAPVQAEDFRRFQTAFYDAVDEMGQDQVAMAIDSVKSGGDPTTLRALMEDVTKGMHDQDLRDYRDLLQRQFGLDETQVAQAFREQGLVLEGVTELAAEDSLQDSMRALREIRDREEGDIRLPFTSRMKDDISRAMEAGPQARKLGADEERILEKISEGMKERAAHRAAEAQSLLDTGEFLGATPEVIGAVKSAENSTFKMIESTKPPRKGGRVRVNPTNTSKVRKIQRNVRDSYQKQMEDIQAIIDALDPEVDAKTITMLERRRDDITRRASEILEATSARQMPTGSSIREYQIATEKMNKIKKGSLADQVSGSALHQRKALKDFDDAIDELIEEADRVVMGQLESRRAAQGKAKYSRAKDIDSAQGASMGSAAPMGAGALATQRQSDLNAALNDILGVREARAEAAASLQQMGVQLGDKSVLDRMTPKELASVRARGGMTSSAGFRKWIDDALEAVRDDSMMDFISNPENAIPDDIAQLLGDKVWGGLSEQDVDVALTKMLGLENTSELNKELRSIRSRISSLMDKVDAGDVEYSDVAEELEQLRARHVGLKDRLVENVTRRNELGIILDQMASDVTGAIPEAPESAKSSFGQRAGRYRAYQGDIGYSPQRQRHDALIRAADVDAVPGGRGSGAMAAQNRTRKVLERADSEIEKMTQGEIDLIEERRAALKAKSAAQKSADRKLQEYLAERERILSGYDPQTRAAVEEIGAASGSASLATLMYDDDGVAIPTEYKDSVLQGRAGMAPHIRAVKDKLELNATDLAAAERELREATAVFDSMQSRRDEITRLQRNITRSKGGVEGHASQIDELFEALLPDEVGTVSDPSEKMARLLQERDRSTAHIRDLRTAKERLERQGAELADELETAMRGQVRDQQGRLGLTHAQVEAREKAVAELTELEQSLDGHFQDQARIVREQNAVLERNGQKFDGLASRRTDMEQFKTFAAAREGTGEVDDLATLLATSGQAKSPLSGMFTGGADLSPLVGGLSPEAAAALEEITVRQVLGAEEAAEVFQRHIPSMADDVAAAYGRAGVDVGKKIRANMEQAKALFGDDLVEAIQTEATKKRLTSQGLTSRVDRALARTEVPYDPEILGQMFGDEVADVDEALSAMENMEPGGGRRASGGKGQSMGELMADRYMDQGIQAEEVMEGLQARLDDLQAQEEAAVRQGKRETENAVRRHRRRLERELKEATELRDEALERMDALTQERVVVDAGKEGGSEVHVPDRDRGLNAHEVYMASMAQDADEFLASIADTDIAARAAEIADETEEAMRAEIAAAEEMDNFIRARNAALIDDALDDDIRKANRARAGRAALLGGTFNPVDDMERGARADMLGLNMLAGADMGPLKQGQVDDFMRMRQSQQMEGLAGMFSMMGGGGPVSIDDAMVGAARGGAGVDVMVDSFTALDAAMDVKGPGRFRRGLDTVTDGLKGVRKPGQALTKSKGILNAATWLNPLKSVRALGGAFKGLGGAASSAALGPLQMILGSGGAGGGAASGIAAGLGGVVSFLPIIIAVAAVLLVVWKNWDKIQKGFGEGIERIKAAFQGLIDAVLTPIKGLFERLSGDSENAGLAGQQMGDMWETIGGVIDWVADKVAVLIEWLTPIINRIVSFIAMLIEVIINHVQMIIDVFKGDWDGVWEHAQEIFHLFSNWFRNTFATVIGEIAGFIFKIPAYVIEAVQMAAEAFAALQREATSWLGPLEGAANWVNPMDDWADNLAGALDGTTDEIYAASDQINRDVADWIRPDEDLWNDAGENVAEEMTDEAQDTMDDNPLEPSIDYGQVHEEAVAKTKEFINAFKSRMQAVVDGWKQSAMDAFGKFMEQQREDLQKVSELLRDMQNEVHKKQMDQLEESKQAELDRIEAKKDAIDDEVKAERLRDQDLEYLRRKEEMRERRRSALVSHQTDRDLAIYEGRYDDAKQMDYEYGQEIQQLMEDEQNLEKDRQQQLTDRVREAERERLDIQREAIEQTYEMKKEALEKEQELQKKALQEHLDLQKKALDERLNAEQKALQRQLDLITEYIPRNRAEADRMQAQIRGAIYDAIPSNDAAARASQESVLGKIVQYTPWYGVQGSLQGWEWQQGWDTAMKQASADVADAAYWAGDAAMRSFAEGLGIDPNNLSAPTKDGKDPNRTVKMMIGPYTVTGKPGQRGMIGPYPYQIPEFHTGGQVGATTSGPNDVPATLQSGEYVIQRSAVQKYGTDFMDGVNNQKFHTGGMVSKGLGQGMIAKSGLFNSFRKLAYGWLAGANTAFMGKLKGVEGGLTSENYRSALQAKYNQSLGGVASVEGYSGGGTPGSGPLAGVHPRLVAAFNAYNQALGNKFRVVSGYRSFAEQAALYAKYGPGRAAPPGSSNHEYGLAIDHGPNSTASDRARAGEFGLVYRMSHEPWHVEVAGLNRHTIGRGPGAATEVEEATSGIAQYAGLLRSDLFRGAPGAAPVSGPVPEGVAAIKNMVRSMMPGYGWNPDDHWGALDQLVTHESGWNPLAKNPSSTASGLFQFLDSTWRNYGHSYPDWPRDPRIQARSGLQYIKERYGNPSAAWSFWNRQSPHWYHQGGMVFPTVPQMMVGGSILKDGVAKVHQGETVVTKKLSDGIANSNMGGPTFNIEVTGPFFGSERELEDLAAKIERKITPKLNRAKGMENRRLSKR